MVLTDGGNQSVWELVEKEFPSIVVGWCAAHVLDLLMEDIGKMPWFEKLFVQAKVVVKFIRGHQVPDALLKQKSSKLLLLPGETRFGTCFIMLQRLLEVQAALEEIVNTENWALWVKGKKPDLVATAKQVKQHINNENLLGSS